MKKILMILIIIIVLIGGGLTIMMFNSISAGGLSLFSDNSSLSLVNTQAISLDNIDSIELSYVSENIQIFESDTEELILKEYMNKDEEKLYAKITKNGASLNIKHGSRTAQWMLRSRAELYLPVSYKNNFSAASVSGSIGTDAPYEFNQLKLSSVSGSIRFSQASVDQLDVRTTSGSVSIDRASGDQLNLESTSGSVKMGQAYGNRLNLKTTSGSISIQKVQGPVDASTVSGSITIGNGLTGGDLKSTSGKIELILPDLTEDLKVAAVSGSVMIKISPKLSFHFSAASTSGGIHTFFEDKLKKVKRTSASGTVGNNPQCHIDLSTTSGSIKVVE